ncbi:MAG: pilus assembly protein PilM [Candidatus Zixiibacteriota bacterium]
MPSALIQKMFRRSAPPEQVAETPAKSVLFETPLAPRKHFEWGTRLGFAVDQTGIQMAAARHTAGRVALVDARKVYFPASDYADRGTFITQTISEFTGRFTRRNLPVSLAVTGPETVFRTFHVPNLRAGAFDAAVQFEAKKQIPFPIKDCQFGYRSTYRLGTDSRFRVKVALHAAKSSFVQEQMAPFEQCGLDVGHVYHSHDALGHLLCYLPDFSEDKLYTLLSVERQHAELSYFRGSNLEFFHICSVGSSFLARRSDPTIFEYFAEALAGEIQNSLDYYTGQYSSQFSNRIYIHGDLSYSDELIRLLTDRFGFEFARFPGETLCLPGSDREPISACLPAVAAATCNVRLADLLPRDHVERHRARLMNRVALAAAVVILTTLLGIWLFDRHDLADQQTRLDALTVEMENFKASNLYDTYNMLKREIATSRTYLEKCKPTPGFFSALVRDLSQITPSPIRLSNLDYTGSIETMNVHLQGRVLSDAIPPEVLLAEYVETLNASPLLDSVVVQQYSKRPEKGSFALDFVLDMRYLQ